MKSRNVFTALTGSAVAMMVLASCAGPSGGAGGLDGEGQTLTFMIQANGLYPEEQKAWFGKVNDAFQEKTGAKVEFETFATANEELTRIQTSVLSGQGPDIYGLGTTFTPTAYATGAFVTLTDDKWELVGGRERFIPALLGISGPSENDEVGIPFASRPFVMAYNQDILDVAGISEVPTTWDDLAVAAAKATTGDVHGLAIAYADNFDPWKFIWGMSVQEGNPVIDVADMKSTIDDPAVSTAYEAYFGWYQAGLVDPASIGWKSAQAVAAFADGKAAFLPMTSATSKVVLDGSSVADSYGYALLPLVPPGSSERPAGGVEAASILSGDNLVVAEYSPNQELAFALIEMITTEEWQVDYFDTFGELPTGKAAAQQIEEQHPQLAATVEAAAMSVATPFTGAWGDTQLALTNVVVQSLPALQAGTLDTPTIAAAVKSAAASAQSALDKAK